MIRAEAITWGETSVKAPALSKMRMLKAGFSALLHRQTRWIEKSFGALKWCRYFGVTSCLLLARITNHFCFQHRSERVLLVGGQNAFRDDIEGPLTDI